MKREKEKKPATKEELQEFFRTHEKEMLEFMYKLLAHQEGLEITYKIKRIDEGDDKYEIKTVS